MLEKIHSQALKNRRKAKTFKFQKVKIFKHLKWSEVRMNLKDGGVVVLVIES